MLVVAEFRAQNILLTFPSYIINAVSKHTMVSLVWNRVLGQQVILVDRTLLFFNRPINSSTVLVER